METRRLEELRSSFSGISRRDLLKGATTIAATTFLTQALPVGAQSPGTVLAYVGAYTPNSQGIQLFQVNLGTGALTPVKVFPSVNSSWLSFDPTNHFLYAVNEISNFNGTTSGSVSAFAVDQSNGNLTFLNAVSSQGSGPAHLSIHPSGKFVFVANYGGGSVAVLPVLADGSLGNATDVVADFSACIPSCPVGPTHAENAPPGSFAISGHDAPHAHMIQSAPGGQFVIVNDLGLDLTIVYGFDAPTGRLINPKTVPSSAGAGPRHFAFHPNGVWFYSLNEEASTILFMTYDANTGTLTPVEEISTLPATFVGTNFTSEIMVSADGSFVYAANRLHDSIGVFRVRNSGQLHHVSEAWTRGDYPRSFNIDPTGSYLYSCNQRADSITVFSIQDDGSHLAFTGNYVPVGSPASIVFLTLP